MTSQKDKPSEIAATTNAAARRFLSVVTNCLPPNFYNEPARHCDESKFQFAMSKSGHVQCSSACPLWANMDMPGLFDQLIGANEQTQWQLDPNGLGGLRIDE